MPAPATHRSVMLPCHCLQWGGLLAVLLLAGWLTIALRPEQGKLEVRSEK